MKTPEGGDLHRQTIEDSYKSTDPVPIRSDEGVSDDAWKPTTPDPRPDNKIPATTGGVVDNDSWKPTAPDPYSTNPAPLPNSRIILTEEDIKSFHTKLVEIQKAATQNTVADGEDGAKSPSPFDRLAGGHYTQRRYTPPRGDIYEISKQILDEGKIIEDASSHIEERPIDDNSIRQDFMNTRPGKHGGQPVERGQPVVDDGQGDWRNRFDEDTVPDQLLVQNPQKGHDYSDPIVATFPLPLPNENTTKPAEPSEYHPKKNEALKKHKRSYFGQSTNILARRLARKTKQNLAQGVDSIIEHFKHDKENSQENKKKDKKDVLRGSWFKKVFGKYNKREDEDTFLSHVDYANENDIKAMFAKKPSTETSTEKGEVDLTSDPSFEKYDSLHKAYVDEMKAKAAAEKEQAKIKEKQRLAYKQLDYEKAVLEARKLNLEARKPTIEKIKSTLKRLTEKTKDLREEVVQEASIEAKRGKVDLLEWLDRGAHFLDKQVSKKTRLVTGIGLACAGALALYATPAVGTIAVMSAAGVGARILTASAAYVGAQKLITKYIEAKEDFNANRRDEEDPLLNLKFGSPEKKFFSLVAAISAAVMGNIVGEHLAPTLGNALKAYIPQINETLFTFGHSVTSQDITSIPNPTSSGVVTSIPDQVIATPQVPVQPEVPHAIPEIEVPGISSELLSHKVQPGENLWQIVKKTMEASNFEGYNELPQALKEWRVAEAMSRLPHNPVEYGISSGDINTIRVGETIDLRKAFSQ